MGFSTCFRGFRLRAYVLLGGDNHLNIVIADYKPNVRCDRTPTPGPPWESCLAIAADMSASRDRKVFGDKSRDPRVEVNLPHYYKASTFDPRLLIFLALLASIRERCANSAALAAKVDARCMATIDISGKSTSATWYEIWEAMTALAAMCVRAQSKGGKAFGLGEYTHNACF